MTDNKLQLSQPDEELVKRAKEGDKSAFEKLVLRYEVRIYNLIYRMVGNQAVAKDILQETFLQAYHKLKTFRGRAQFFTWIYRIAVNYCLMYLRKKKNTVSIDDDLNSEENKPPRQIPDWSDNPEITIENKELKDKLQGAIGLLPREYGSVVILRDVEGLSNSQTSKILNLSVPTIKSRIHRARVFLRDKLSNYIKNKV